MIGRCWKQNTRAPLLPEKPTDIYFVEIHCYESTKTKRRRLEKKTAANVLA